MTDLTTRLAQADKPTRELLKEAAESVWGEYVLPDYADWMDGIYTEEQMRWHVYLHRLDAEAWTSAVEMLVPSECAQCYASGWGVDGRGFATIGFDRSIYALHPVNALAIACLKARGL